MPALGLRTIWIALRAVNYTDRAFQATMLNLDNLTKKEAIIAQATHRAAVQGLMAGMMWMTFGGMLGQAGMEMARTTTALKPFVNAVDSLAKTMGQSEALRTFVSILLLAVSALMIFGGAAMMVKAIQDLEWLPSVGRMIAAHQVLAGAIGAVTAGFMIFIIIGQIIGKQAGAVVAGIAAITAALLALAVAMNIVSLGTLTPLQLATFAAGAAMAAGVMALGKYQMGTRSAGKTGLALVHKHEVIYNPTTNRPTQIGNDLSRGGGETNFYEMPVTIETVNTKADIDDLDEKLSEAWRRRMRRRR
jgi:hypothetical protein